ncbi:HNH endonuclease signature motif containing protein [Paraburkholderia phenoliruptrix]|uniref:HNH endonuclease signature motif containing protein n=1 Tax=Paraburkholderia phenoliruptrix TaxID=252970 RepID=UPI0035B5443A
MYTVDQETQCWNWNGRIAKNGYGVQRVGRSCQAAHRYVFILIKGEIPAGLELDHLCRNRACVNPEHMEPVTHMENMLRSPVYQSRIQAMTCSKGHPLDGVRTRNGGGRYCRTCVRDSKRRQRAMPPNNSVRETAP